MARFAAALPDHPERARSVLAAWLPALLVAASACYVFRGALHTYFAQEDFLGLAVGAGVLPRHVSLWRYVSTQGFWDLFYPWFRDDAWPYHAVVLAIHAVNAVFLYRLLAGPGGRPAALIGAAFFAVHPTHFTALYWQSARADVLAGTFSLVTIALACRPGRQRWLAVPALAAALLSKESVLALPAVVILIRWWRNDRPKGGPADRLSLALVLMSVAYGLYLFLPKRAGIPIGFDAQAAYGFDFGLPLVRNLLTYVGWAVDLARLTPGLRYVDTQNPDLFPLAAFVLTAGAFLLISPALRRRGFHVGLGCFLLLLVPVLPLRNHTYHYYLYVPLLSAALCLAALAAVLLDRLGQQNEARRWSLAGLAWLALTWNGDRVVQHMEARRTIAYPQLHGDPTVDRARIAERAIATLRQAPLPSGTELVLLSRARVALLGRILRGSGEPPPPTEEAYPESNVRAALYDGMAVRALIPAVDSVALNRNVGPGTARRRYGIYAATGEIEVYDAATLDSLLRSPWVDR